MITMQVNEKVSIIETGKQGSIINISHSSKGSAFYNRNLAIIRLTDGSLVAKTENEIVIL